MKYAIIHIADIHYKEDEPEGASNILEAFADDLDKHRDILNGFEFRLAITGDIVFSGSNNRSYERFLAEFDTRLNRIGVSNNSRMMVPGNHDIDRDVVESLLKKEKDETHQSFYNEADFNNLVDKGNFHSGKFDNYKLFESEFSKVGIDFNNEGKGWKIDDNLGVYCLNTAIGSYGGLSKKADMGNLPIYTRGIYKWCRDTDTNLNILLMHHPIDHLTAWSKNELKQLLEKNFTLCLCGHNHEQNLHHNKLSRNSLICSAPQLFTNKNDDLGYAIICIEDNIVTEIRYRQYNKGKFFNGQIFAENDEGIVVIDSQGKRNIEKLEKNLNNSLAFFKNQKSIFIKPKLSENREFNEDDNLLDAIIENPSWYVIIAQPQFGLSSVSHYLRLEAYKKDKFWIYLDAKHLKSRNVLDNIDTQLQEYGKSIDDICCIIVDSWDSSELDHKNMAKRLKEEFKSIPLIIMCNYVETYYSSIFDFKKINENFKFLHLQALQVDKIREFVSKHYSLQNNEIEDLIVEKLILDLDALNIHRTPLNCLTLMKVFENNFTGDLINRTKLIKTVLAILFTDAESFTYATNKPDPSDCEYVLGEFCRTLINNRTRHFPVITFREQLENICKLKLISIDIEVLVDILEENHIIIKVNNDFYFKHSYWIYYFASINMIQDPEFESYILSDQNYINFPEIIEFYTGQDGRRSSAIVTLTNDLQHLIKTVDDKIGIKDRFNPLKGFLWVPTPGNIRNITEDLSHKVQRSNLPTAIKDHHADKNYNSEAPYNQSINEFMNEYSVLSLMQGIKASSKALRNSNYVDTELRKTLLSSIFFAWEQVSKVLFYISPTLAKEGRAWFDGMGFILIGDFGNTYKDQLKSIFLANPMNVNSYFKDSLSSKKIGPLVFENLENNSSELQMLLIVHFLISERPIGWHRIVFDFMNLLHRNSFFLGNLFDAINLQISKGFVSNDDLAKLKLLVKIVAAKHMDYKKGSLKNIPDNMTKNEANKLPIDKILAEKKGPKPRK